MPTVWKGECRTKRTISVLLAAVLILGLSCQALAYEEEITWHEIAWGSSPEEVSQALADAGIVEDLGVDLTDETMYAGYQVVPSDARVVGAKNQELYSTLMKSVYIKELGGLTVDNLVFDYIHEVKDGAVDWDTSYLAQVSLVFMYESIDDIKAALDAIYGEAVEATVSTYYTKAGSTWCWYGENDTAVGLTKWFDVYPLVIFGKTDTQEIVAEQKALLGGD